MATLKRKTNNGYEPLPAMVVRKTNAENGNGIGTCSTSSGTALTVSLTNYELVQNGFVAVTFENDVPANATLNVNGKGAKPIYYKGSAIEADTIKADDTALFSYDGTNYVLISSGGSGSIPQEELTISLASNQTADTGLNGATITVTQTRVVEPLYSGTWAGTNIVMNIDAGIEYTVTVGSVTGYATPATQTYSSLGYNSRTATFTYNTEVLTATITKNGGNADISAKTVVVKDQNNNILGTLTNGQSIKIPYGVIYTATASDISIADYFNPFPNSITKDWNDTPAKSLTFIYRYAPEAVDLGLPSGLLWCKHNVGAASETDYGLYFSYGNVTGCTQNAAVDNGTPYAQTNGSTLTASIQQGGAYDAARANMGGDWMMPSKAQCQELIDNTTTEYVSDYKGSGINGVLFTSSVAGYTNRSIFIPFNGWKRTAAQPPASGNVYGYYRVIDYYNSANAGLFSVRNPPAITNDARIDGYGIRAVV